MDEDSARARVLARTQERAAVSCVSIVRLVSEEEPTPTDPLVARGGVGGLVLDEDSVRASASAHVRVRTRARDSIARQRS